MANFFRSKKINWKFLVLLLIFGIGIFLRLFRLSGFPQGFHSQEAIVGYRAFSLLTTGRDETGRRWPFFFASFEDYQLPVQTYLTVISVKIFGLSPFAVRFPGAILGSFLVFAFYGSVNEFFPKNEKVAFSGAFLAAIIPWGIFSSRIAFPEGLSFSLFILGFYLLLRKKNNIFFLLAAFVFFLLSLCTAKVSWFFLPLFLLLLSIKRKMFGLDKEVVLLTISFLVIFVSLLVSFFRLPQASKSILYHDLSLITDVGISNGINSMRGEELKSGNPLLGRLFFNKSFWLIKYLERFLAHFSPVYYFAIGDQNPLRGLWNFGPFYLCLIVPTLFGLWTIIKEKDEKGKFLIIWICLGAIVSALVKKSPDGSRLIFSFPVLLLLVSLGMKTVFNHWWRWLFIAVFVFNIAVVAFDTVQKEPIRGQRYWFYNFEKIADILKTNSDKGFTKIYLTDGYAPDPAPLLLFFWKYQPLKIQNKAKPIRFRYWMNQIDNIQIGQIDEFSIERGETGLFVVSLKEERELLSRLVVLGKENKPTGKLCYETKKEIKDLSGKTFLLVASSVSKNCELIRLEK